MEIKKQRPELKEFLPIEGIWNVESFASYLKIPASTVTQKLSDFGIKTMKMGIRYETRLINMADIVKYFEK